MSEARIAELLDELTPRYDDRVGDWERVATTAASRRGRRIAPLWLVRLGFVAAAVAAAGTLVLAWPFHANEGGILDRARAAIGEGPVLHVVLRGEWGGTLVELGSGERSPVYGEDEVWYDTQGGSVHTIERLGGVVQHEELSKPRQTPADLAALGREYKQALEEGTARISGESTIDGEPVAWITIHSELLPDVADGKDHEWAQRVAVSRRTFKPVALRETRDGEPGQGTEQRVLDLQLLPAGAGDFTAPPDLSLNGMGGRLGRVPIALEQVGATLGRTPLWLGREYAGLPLGQVDRETMSIGRQTEVRLSGAKAAAAIRCTKARHEPGGAGACFRALGLSSVSVRPDGVFTSQGPIVWNDKQTSVVLFYGTVGDDPSTFREDTVPLFDRPYVTVSESTQASTLRRGAGSYVPPAGSVFIAAGGAIGVLHLDGIHVTIDASGEQAILAATRALKAMPG
jgi:hypothetical protein